MSYYNQDLLLKLENENTVLKAKLAEIEKQEPFGWFSDREDFTRNESTVKHFSSHGWRPLYASPVQQSPALADRFKGRKLPSNPISEIMEPNDIVEQPDSAGENNPPLPTEDSAGILIRPKIKLE